MRILHVLDDSIYRFAGVPFYILNLAKWFIDNGHEVTILHCNNKNVPPHDIDKRIEIIELAQGFDFKIVDFNGSVSPISGIVSKQRIQGVFKKHFDIVHFHYPFSPFFSGRILKHIAKFQKNHRPKTVCTFQIYVEEKPFVRFGNKLLGIVSLKILQNIDIFLHHSSVLREYGLEYVHKDSIYLPVGSTSFDIRSKPGILVPDKKPLILFLGRFEKRKGVLDLIEALNIINKRFPLLDEVDIAMTGDGPLREDAMNLSKQYGLNISFPGKVSNKGKEESYFNADLCIFPAKYGEAFGVVLIEAMNFGCSIIAYENPGYKDTMKGFEECLVQINDVEKLSDRIQLFIKEKDKLIFNLGKRLKENFNKKFDIEVVGKQLLSIYKS